MADVTISSLTRGTPTGGNVLPYSTGSNTLGVSVSAILQNAGSIGIGTANPVSKLDVHGAGNFTAVEVGKSGQSGNRYAFVDLTGDDTYTDYGLRILRGNTPNTDSVITTRGTGTLVLQTEQAGSILLKTNLTDRMLIDSSGNVSITGKLTNSGVAKAWVNFNGQTGTQVGAEFQCTIRSQYNVSSVVRVRNGVYRINFATAMSNANYMTQYTGGYEPTQDTRVFHTINSDVPPTAANVTVTSTRQNGTQFDTDLGNVLVFST